jgi:hypothetical protein
VRDARTRRSLRPARLARQPGRTPQDVRADELWRPGRSWQVPGTRCALWRDEGVVFYRYRSIAIVSSARRRTTAAVRSASRPSTSSRRCQGHCRFFSGLRGDPTTVIRHCSLSSRSERLDIRSASTVGHSRHVRPAHLRQQLLGRFSLVLQSPSRSRIRRRTGTLLN